MSLPEHTLTVYDHPETHSHRWSDLELESIKRYAEVYALQAVEALCPAQQSVQPRTFDDRNAQFREENWQIRFDAAVEARREAQEQLYAARERFNAEVKKLQAEIGRLKASQEQALHLGACITDGKLHVTVMRREANGHVTIVAMAEMDAASLAGRDCIAEMKASHSQAQQPIPAPKTCSECGKALNQTEIEYYGSTCEQCEGKRFHAVESETQQPSPATPADIAVYQSIADGYTKAQQPSAEVVAWQCKFKDSAEWSQCSKEHHDWVKRCPHEFVGYEARSLTLATPKPEPMTLNELYCCLQWFDHIQDVHAVYLDKHDYVLAHKLYEALGMSVPASVTKGQA